MKNGTLCEASTDLCFSAIGGGKVYLHAGEIVIFIETIQKYNMKMIFFLHKNQLFRHDISIEAGEDLCFKAWFK